MTKICSKVASKSETIMRERLAYEYYTSNVRVYIYIYENTVARAKIDRGHTHNYDCDV